MAVTPRDSGFTIVILHLRSCRRGSAGWRVTPYSVYMDDSAAMVVEQLIEIALDEDTACIVMGLSGPAAGTLEALNVLGRVPADRFVATRDEARETARRILEA